MPSALSSGQILSLKRRALEAKKAGDIEGAKNLLRQAKQLEASTEEAQKSVATERSEAGDPIHDRDCKEDALQTTEASETETEDVLPSLEDPVNQAIDSASLEELKIQNAMTSTTFGNAELLDVESLQDLRDCGMEIPSQQLYDKRILACKQQALQHKKANNIPKAKQVLLTAKQLTAAKGALYESKNSSSDTQEADLLAELSQEDAGLLAELQNYDDHGKSLLQEHNELDLTEEEAREESNNNVSTRLTIHDILEDDMDAGALQDMMEAGFALPSVDDVQALAQQRQAAAVAAKKVGDLDAAKAALQDSKRLQAKAAVLAAVKRKASIANHNLSSDHENDAAPDLDHALERLFQQAASTEETRQGITHRNTSATVPQSTKPSLQPASHYKAEALHHKKNGENQKALAALRLYKQALVVEAKVKAAEDKDACLAQLKVEIETAKEQDRIFSYYRIFVDPKLGSTMAAGWRRYGRDCRAYSSRVMTTDGKTDQSETDSGELPVPTRLERSQTAALYRLSDVGFIGSSCDVAEERLEISVVALLRLHDNQRLRKIISADDQSDTSHSIIPVNQILIRLVGHLPANEHALEQDVQLEFAPTQLLNEGKTDHIYLFDASQFIHAERGSTRFAKTFARRLTRRRCLTFEVICLQPKNKASSGGGIFGRFGNSKPVEMEELSLGVAGLELKDLLESNYVAADLPLVENRKELGGVVRVAVRSGSSFGNLEQPTALTAAATTTTIPPLEGFPHLLLPR